MVQVIDSITTVVRESSKIAKPRQTRQARRPVAELYLWHGQCLMVEKLGVEWSHGDGHRAVEHAALVQLGIAKKSVGGGGCSLGCSFLNSKAPKKFGLVQIILP